MIPIRNFRFPLVFSSPESPANTSAYFYLLHHHAIATNVWYLLYTEIYCFPINIAHPVDGWFAFVKVGQMFV